MKKLSWFIAPIMALSLCSAAPVQAADYPSRPITLMTAFNAGGGSDVSHRLIEKYARGVISKPVVVTYKPGAGGEVGWTWLVGARADGYTVGGVDLPHIVLQPLLRAEGQPGYQTEQLNPLCNLVFDPDVVMVRKDSPFQSFEELVAYAKANPGKLKVGTVGKFTGDHLFLMQIEKLTGASFTQVPYPGGGKAAPALLSGEVDCYFGSTSNFLRMEGARGLAIATEGRYSLCPYVPTFAEQGYKLESAKYRGIATPPNFPKEAQEYLEARLAEVCADPEYQEAVRGAGLTPYYTGGKEFGEIIQREKAKAADILKGYGLIR